MISTHKNILVGSETSSSLAAIIKSLQEVDHYSCITATRISDIIQLSKSIQPALIILSFRDNQSVINALTTYDKESVIPILCLKQKNEYRNLRIQDDKIVFIQSYEYMTQDNNLSTNVKGLLKLVQHTETQKSTYSIAQKTIVHKQKNKDLTRYVLELDQKKLILDKIKDRIKQLCADVDTATRTKLMSIVNTIKMTRTDKKHWEDFKIYFENINPNFLKELSKKYPCLTAKDLKYCCYLKMNMSNEDIRYILGINQESVRTHKYRLKKKMVLSKNQDLRQYLQSFVN